MIHVDFAGVRAGRLPYAEAIRDLDRDALRALTIDSFDTVDGIVAALPEFALGGPSTARNEMENAEPWALARVITHLTATSEEAAALASSLARGIELHESVRSRAEIPWQDVTTTSRLKRRLIESRRICLGFLDTWPDAPRLDLRLTPVLPFGPLDAIGIHVLGLMHADDHHGQLRETVRLTLGSEQTGVSTQV